MSDTIVKILDFLHPPSVVRELKATTKKAALEELASTLLQDGRIVDVASVVQVLLEREKIGSTGIGQGIAIPHAKTEQSKTLVAALGLSRKGIPFDSLDGEPVHIVFMLIAPPEAAADHLKALARISRMLKDKFFRQSLRDSKDSMELLKLIREEDNF